MCSLGKYAWIWLSWPSANSNKLFRVLKQLHWEKFKNISWHALTPSMDPSSLCKNKDVSVSHLYSLCFFRVMLLWGISILYSCQQYSRASECKFCCSWSAFDRAAYWVAGERTSRWHRRRESGLGWIKSCKAKSWAYGTKNGSFQVKSVISGDVIKLMVLY